MTVGQAMAFHKSFWQILLWQPIGGYFLPTPRNKFAHLDLWVKDHRGVPSKIKYKHHSEPNEGLGLNMCPNGDQDSEFEKRLKQAETFSEKVMSTRFHLGEAWTALTVCTLPSITYTFSVTRFTKQQLHRLAVLIDNAFLPKLGINRKMKRIAVYAPVELGGINYPSIESIQDQKGISLFVRELQAGKEIATDLKILLSLAQLESGFVQPILEETSLQAPYLEPGIISHLRYRLNELDGRISVEGAWQPELQRVGDVPIMEALVQLPGVKKGELAHANQCRKYIHVVTLAEAASLCGTFIPPNRFNGRWRAKSNLKWPRQPPPTGVMWDTFRRLMKRAFCQKNLRAQKNHRIPLDKPLGEWYRAVRHVQYAMLTGRETVSLLPN